MTMDLFQYKNATFSGKKVLIVEMILWPSSPLWEVPYLNTKRSFSYWNKAQSISSNGIDMISNVTLLAIIGASKQVPLQ